MKRWWQSRTVWANVLTFVLVTLGVLGGSPLLATWADELLLATALVNVWLRFVTREGIR